MLYYSDELHIDTAAVLEAECSMRRGLIFCGVVDEVVELLVTVVVADGVTADS